MVGFTRAPAILDEWDELEQLKYVVDVNGDGIDELLDYSGNSIGGCDFLKYWDGTTTASKKLGCWSEA